MKRSFTVLYVDDDYDDLHLISEAFRQFAGHLNVIHANNGIEGLVTLDDLYKQRSLPCLLIIDINMPVMDGKQMLRKLRELPKYYDLPVILFSTSSSSTDRAFAEKYGAEFISKPDNYTELESLVEQFVNRCRFEVKNSA